MQFDILDPNFSVGDPYPAYAWLRENAPVCWDEKNQLWLVSKYDDIVHVSRNPKIFSSAQGVMPDSDTLISIVSIDDPRHAQLRGLIQRGFTPRMVKTLRDVIDTLVTESIDVIAERGSCDFVEDLAVDLPLIVIAEMIGIEKVDRKRFHYWSDNMIVAAAQNDNMEILERATRCYQEYAEYLQDIFEDRRKHPRDDLVSVLVAAQTDGTLAEDSETIAADELLQFMTILLVAGNETTRNTLSGGMLALSEYPEEYARLVANPDLVGSATEEIIRWVAPVQLFRRTATQDTELRGHQIRKGQKVVMLYQSANRDADQFSEPDTFKIDREPNYHLSFGVGPHFCLGANLARFEIRAMFSELIRRLPDMRVAPGAGPTRIPSPLVRGIGKLPVVFTPESQQGARGAEACAS